eukprot:853218-Amphidinium_carterae.1
MRFLPKVATRAGVMFLARGHHCQHHGLMVQKDGWLKCNAAGKARVPDLPHSRYKSSAEIAMGSSRAPVFARIAK